MANNGYFGQYARFDTASKNEGAGLVSADNLVGDVFTIEFDFEDGQRIAWIKNRFGARMGFFDAEVSSKLNLCEARGWTLHALLAFVAYDEPEGGHYWGQVALICFDKKHEEAFEAFTKAVGKRLSEGIRPQVELADQGVQQVIESGGTWQPKKTVPLPKKTAGTALVKTRLSATEKLVEQGRARNKGCYVGSILLLAAILAAITLTLKACNVL